MPRNSTMSPVLVAARCRREHKAAAASCYMRDTAHCEECCWTLPKSRPLPKPARCRDRCWQLQLAGDMKNAAATLHFPIGCTLPRPLLHFGNTLCNAETAAGSCTVPKNSTMLLLLPGATSCTRRRKQAGSSRKMYRKSFAC